MNKRFLITFLSLTGIVIAGVFFSSVNNDGLRMGSGEENDIAEIHAVYKKDCKIIEPDGDSEQIYKNTGFGFQFLLMRHLLVCERVFITEEEKDEISEISVWERGNFHSRIPRIGPLVIIHIHAGAPAENFRNQFPEPIVISKKEITLDGMIATRKEIRSSLCVHSDCPIVRTYDFKTNDRSFIIEERGAQDIVIGSWKFHRQ